MGPKKAAAKKGPVSKKEKTFPPYPPHGCPEEELFGYLEANLTSKLKNTLKLLAHQLHLNDEQQLRMIAHTLKKPKAEVQALVERCAAQEAASTSAPGGTSKAPKSSTSNLLLLSSDFVEKVATAIADAFTRRNAELGVAIKQRITATVLGGKATALDSWEGQMAWLLPSGFTLPPGEFVLPPHEDDDQHPSGPSWLLTEAHDRLDLHLSCDHAAERIEDAAATLTALLEASRDLQTLKSLLTSYNASLPRIWREAMDSFRAQVADAVEAGPRNVQLYRLTQGPLTQETRDLVLTVPERIRSTGQAHLQALETLGGEIVQVFAALQAKAEELRQLEAMAAASNRSEDRAGDADVGLGGGQEPRESIGLPRKEGSPISIARGGVEIGTEGGRDPTESMIEAQQHVPVTPPPGDEEQPPTPPFAPSEIHADSRPTEAPPPPGSPGSPSSPPPEEEPPAPPNEGEPSPGLPRPSAGATDDPATREAAMDQGSVPPGEHPANDLSPATLPAEEWSLPMSLSDYMAPALSDARSFLEHHVTRMSAALEPLVADVYQDFLGSLARGITGPFAQALMGSPVWAEQLTKSKEALGDVLVSSAKVITAAIPSTPKQRTDDHVDLAVRCLLGLFVAFNAAWAMVETTLGVKDLLTEPTAIPEVQEPPPAVVAQAQGYSSLPVAPSGKQAGVGTEPPAASVQVAPIPVRTMGEGVGQGWEQQDGLMREPSMITPDGLTSVHEPENNKEESEEGKTTEDIAPEPPSKEAPPLQKPAAPPTTVLPSTDVEPDGALEPQLDPAPLPVEGLSFPLPPLATSPSKRQLPASPSRNNSIRVDLSSFIGRTENKLGKSSSTRYFESLRVPTVTKDDAASRIKQAQAQKRAVAAACALARAEWETSVLQSGLNTILDALVWRPEKPPVPVQNLQRDIIALGMAWAKTVGTLQALIEPVTDLLKTMGRVIEEAELQVELLLQSDRAFAKSRQASRALPKQASREVSLPSTASAAISVEGMEQAANPEIVSGALLEAWTSVLNSKTRAVADTIHAAVVPAATELATVCGSLREKISTLERQHADALAVFEASQKGGAATATTSRRPPAPKAPPAVPWGVKRMEALLSGLSSLTALSSDGLSSLLAMLRSWARFPTEAPHKTNTRAALELEAAMSWSSNIEGHGSRSRAVSLAAGRKRSVTTQKRTQLSKEVAAMDEAIVETVHKAHAAIRGAAQQQMELVGEIVRASI